MMNNTNLIGRLTKDPKLDTTANGKLVTSFILAVKRKFKDEKGNHQSDFIQIVIWGKTAERFCQWTKKGTLIAIEGSIRTRNYDNNQGQRVYVTEVLAEGFDILEKKKDNEVQNHIQNQPSQPIYDPYDLPAIPPDFSNM